LLEVLEPHNHALPVLVRNASTSSAAAERLPRIAKLERVGDHASREPGLALPAWHLIFLTDEDDRATYRSVMRRALAPGGAFVIGTFAEDGATHCSGLPVRRHSPADFLELLGDIEVVEQWRSIHHTPGGAARQRNWIAGRIVPARSPAAGRARR